MGNIIRKFIDLRAKIYSVKIDRVDKKIKGIGNGITARLMVLENVYKKKSCIMILCTCLCPIFPIPGDINRIV